MNQAEALYHIAHWPRFTSRATKPWRPNARGKYLLVDFKRLPDKVEKLVAACNRRRRFNEGRVRYLDLSDPTDIWCLQSRVRFKHVDYFLRNFSAVQKWPDHRLPVVFLFRGHAILWNGHHRMFAARLLRRKLRCAVYRIGKKPPGRRITSR